MSKDDLISRAAAIDAIVSATAFPDAEYIKNLCQNPANSEDWLGGVCDAINAVEDVNTVDAAPVVHARWIKPVPGDGEAYCSNCKHDALPCGYYLNPALMKYYETAYCPNCGAKMDGDA